MDALISKSKDGLTPSCPYVFPIYGGGRVSNKYNYERIPRRAMKFSPGDLVMNAGKHEGQGYIFRVQSYHTTNPYQHGDQKPYIHALCLRPLRGKADPMDWLIGGVVCNPAKNYQPFTGFIPPAQMMQMALTCAN